MALFIRQDDQRSQLRDKITADMQERLRATASVEPNDDSKDALILKNQHHTKAWGIIVTIAIVIVVAILFFVFKPSGN